MKSIVAYIQNRLLSSGIKHAIENNNKSVVELVTEIQSCAATCRNKKPDIFIAEARDQSPLSLEEWFLVINEIRETELNCKIIIIVDEENWPKTAEDINLAFKDKKIDMFFYASSGLNYLADTINNL